MREVADGVHLITGLPPYAINCYLIEHPDGDVLVDAMTRLDAKRILKALRGRRLAGHVVTHAHPDHIGATHAVAGRRGLPVWVHEADRSAVEDPDEIARRQPQHPINQLFANVMLGPGHPVARTLDEGDEVAGFRVLFTPGHSAGHISLWRERDGVLILGDVLNNQHPLLGFPRGLRLPLGIFTPDPETNRRSAKRLGELPARTVLFGHGPPERDSARFRAFTAAL
ncbi:MAG TPA: MBL fold metallo-hydrolase [Solirubrobacteraceae bacterium]|jgi:glyoxylase-like metal-dependent hydrolase (beta-lactamase superfamily II)